MKKVIILCSGGLDSVVCAHYVNRLNYDKLIIIFFNYGQNALINERKFSKNMARDINADFLEIKIDFFQNSHLTQIKKFKKITRKNLKNSLSESKKFYLPNRNGIFISYAISIADKINGADIFLGFNSEGQEAYSDATKKFVDKMNALMKVLKINGKIKCPFINKVYIMGRTSSWVIGGFM